MCLFEVTFPNYGAADHLTGSITVGVIVLDHIELLIYPYPLYDTELYDDEPAVLNLIHCTDTYQRSLGI